MSEQQEQKEMSLEDLARFCIKNKIQSINTPTIKMDFHASAFVQNAPAIVLPEKEITEAEMKRQLDADLFYSAT